MNADVSEAAPGAHARPIPTASVPLAERPIIIVGAPRSGTKILRAAIAAHPAVAEIPHDVNQVWKYGHYDQVSDVLRPSQLTRPTYDYVRSFFERYRANRPGVRVVEKTVATPLRVEFVRCIFPRAQLVHLVRDGRAVAESARREWERPIDWKRGFEKALLLPPSGIPGYAARYVLRYLRRTTGTDAEIASWGPHFPGLDDALPTRSLLEVCALQWKACVDMATAELGRAPASLRLDVRYEELVAHPERVMGEIFRFLDLDYDARARAFARDEIAAGTVEKWRERLTTEEKRALSACIGDTLTRLRYPAD